MSDAFRIQAGSFGQLQPALHFALGAIVAILVQDALAPRAGERRIVTRKDDGILDGNHALVIVALQGPGLQLPAGKQVSFPSCIN